MHGRVEGARDRCAVPGCREPGEFKAPLKPANFNGPGSWRFLCLDHVRAQNAYGGWERSVRAFSPSAGATPVWSDFADPLDAIAARFRHIREGSSARFTKPERRALSVLGLGEDSDRHALRSRYSMLVRRYHPDKNGGDRSHETRLGEVIDAYQLLRRASAFV